MNLSRLLLSAGLLAALAVSPALAHGLGHKPGEKVVTRDIKATDSDAKAREYFTDTVLTSQVLYGRSGRAHSRYQLHVHQL